MKIRKIERKAAQQKIKVAAYCRVSTDKAEQEDSFETQVRAYERMIRSNPKWEYVSVYSDEKSGTSDKREGFQQMISDAEDGRIQYILVKSISRFSRNVVDCRDYIERLQKCGVTVYFERENLESTAPGTSMMLSLMAAIAQDESRSNSENHRWSIQRRYKRGEYKLGNNQILGYDADENGKPIPNGDTWIIQMIFRLYAEGKNISQVAATVNEAGGHCLRSSKPLSAAQVRYILKNEVYVGDRLLQKRHPKNYLTKRPDESIAKESRYLKDCHTGLIDRETWEKAQVLLERREMEKARGIRRKRPNTHYLSGLIYCADCGAAFCRKTLQESGSKASYKVWKCKERTKTDHDKAKLHCASPIVRETAIMNAIAEYLGQDPTEEMILAHISEILISQEGIKIVGSKEDAA